MCPGSLCIRKSYFCYKRKEYHDCGRELEETCQNGLLRPFFACDVIHKADDITLDTLVY